MALGGGVPWVLPLYIMASVGGGGVLGLDVILHGFKGGGGKVRRGGGLGIAVVYQDFKGGGWVL